MNENLNDELGEDEKIHPRTESVTPAENGESLDDAPNNVNASGGAGNEEKADGQVAGKKNFTYFYIALGCFVAGVILLALSVGLAYVVQGIGIYLLISSMICELACASFLNAQKKHGENKYCSPLKIASYVVLGLGVVIFAVGAGIGQSQK